MENKALREAYGEALTELGKINNKIVALDADLCGATMTSLFKKAFPDRFFDFGIAETNMVCEAVGMSHVGLIPFVSTFAIFGAGRAYEQIRNSACYSNANVKFCLTHAGISVGEDGGSHQSIEDLALMRVLPNMTVVVPCDAIETVKATRAVAEIQGPVYLRISRITTGLCTDDDTPFQLGRANVLREGSDVAIFACGLMVKKALEAAEVLSGEGISASVINMHTIKPIDRECVIKYARKCGRIVTAEEHSVIGGLGGAVAEVVAPLGCAKLGMVGIEDKFGCSGKPDELFERYGLTSEHIAEKSRAIQRTDFQTGLVF
ncbi:MAG: transketolase family protein [Oscillospiraceae bacterium]